jgi:hypothetical protein
MGIIVCNGPFLHFSIPIDWISQPVESKQMYGTVPIIFACQIDPNILIAGVPIDKIVPLIECSQQQSFFQVLETDRHIINICTLVVAR